MKRRPRRVPLNGFGEKLDVITLNGMGARVDVDDEPRGLWNRVYKRRGGFPKLNGMKKRCVAWKPVGKGCDCQPRCASFTDPSKGTTKKRAAASCKRKCKTKSRKKRGRR